MNWYYAVGTERKGPIDQTEFDRLVQSGSIAPETLVWREGMADWRPYREIGAIASPASFGGFPTVQCSECGGTFPSDQTIRLSGRPVCATCKPVAMQKVREGIVVSGSEQIRQAHIQHEASVKSVGFLYFMAAAVLLFGGSFSTLAGGDAAAIGIFMLVFGAGLVATGIGLRKLKHWGRVAAGCLSTLGLLGFPIGTLINAYILYLLFSQKGKMVFSEDYKRIIAETPHIKYRTSIVVWVLLGLVVLILILLFSGLAMRGIKR